MRNLEEFLLEYNTSDKRSILYFLGRYLKQAEAFEKYEKDVFDDVAESMPTEDIRSKTMEIVSFIETAVGKRSSNFTTDELLFWMDKIAEIEDTIDVEPSESTVQRAQDELIKFDLPKTTTGS